jgi:hypothetical protein
MIECYPKDFTPEDEYTDDILTTDAVWGKY